MIAALSTLYFPAGLAIGIGAAAPVGPVNLLVIQHRLCRHSGSALLLGLGGALGDCVFAVIAAFGLGALGGLLEAHDALIRIIGGLVMLGFAAIIWRTAPHLNGKHAPIPALRMALVTFTMTLTNPATLLFFLGSFTAIGFTGIGHDTESHAINAALLVSGVLLGSMLWWVFVSGLAGRLRDRATDRHLLVLNQVTAGALAVFGAGAVAAGAAAW